jgi:hypothetical protein
MGDERNDAREARDRCLAAIPGQEFRTQRSLWRAALRYGERCRRETAGLEFSAPLVGFAMGGGE